MTNLIKIQGPRTLNEKINDRGNIEQHYSVNSYPSWNGNAKPRRKGTIVVSQHLANKTGMSFNFFPFY